MAASSSGAEQSDARTRLCALVAAQRGDDVPPEGMCPAAAPPASPAATGSGTIRAVTDDDSEWRVDLDVNLAFQERLIRDLDAPGSARCGDRLAKVEKDFADLKAQVSKPADERPPHY